MRLLAERLDSDYGASVTDQKRRSDAATEHTLLVAAIEGDDASFVELLRRSDRAVRSTAWRLLGDQDQVDDVLQEAYLKAFKSIAKFDPNGAASFGSWLHTIVHSVAIDHHRRAARRPRSATQVDEHHMRQPTSSVALKVAQRASLRTAFATLDTDVAAAVALVDGEGFSQAEAARFLGVSTSTISRHVKDGHDQLRAHLEHAGVIS